MNLKLQLTMAFIVSVLALIGFSFMAFAVSANDYLNFDSKVMALIQGWESPLLTGIMKFFTYIGSTGSIIVLSLFILFFLYKVLKHRLELILFIVVMAGSPLLNVLVKLCFQRTRPDLHRLIEIGGYSFPSGHAMNAMSLYGILTFLLWRHIKARAGRIVLIVIGTMMILAIGISRIYLGVHYPSDIIAGYLAGGFWIAISIWFFQRHQDRRKYKRNERN
ncbi:phosphatase PAP2 family protein [Peribacillus muralis]|uniref:phosphatase PAP2 family protein n=1 Tax=Peribacillus muralis TaxID=264697 RepID=UPI001F4DED21|nr:phosphatase PAP2 family protein [Peribacillus muralis]MCK1992006.1 phosphatase PAP2 family protein [Peribacillus muralis]MCK2012563.1 phosphatase PAP2 family protein [Peribacillus muralis]